MKHFTKQKLTKEERLFLNKVIRKLFKEVYDGISVTNLDSDTKYTENNFQLWGLEDYKAIYNNIAFEFLTKFYNKQLKKELVLDEDDELPEYCYEETEYEGNLYDTFDELYDIICDIVEKIMNEPKFKLGVVSSSYDGKLWFIPEYGKIDLKKKTDYSATIYNIEKLKVLEDYQTDFPVYGIHGFISEDKLYLVSDEQYNAILNEIQ